mmetsp:Transcript_8977/g.17541  ORF Transcript_8977/g.17541 Transcript_8977/m.17541 type:complete len:106 (-) Transcript_8977:1144-1461(-)
MIIISQEVDDTTVDIINSSGRDVTMVNLASFSSPSSLHTLQLEPLEKYSCVKLGTTCSVHHPLRRLHGGLVKTHTARLYIFFGAPHVTQLHSHAAVHVKDMILFH